MCVCVCIYIYITYILHIYIIYYISYTYNIYNIYIETELWVDCNISLCSMNGRVTYVVVKHLILRYVM